MNTIILSCTQGDVYSYLYSDAGRIDSFNACPKTLCSLYPPFCVRLSTKREDGLHYHLEAGDSRFGPYSELCDDAKTILWNEFRTLGYAERFHIDAVRSKHYPTAYTALAFPGDDIE